MLKLIIIFQVFPMNFEKNSIIFVNNRVRDRKTVGKGWAESEMGQGK